ncbi:MAG TPA: PH domain-containing protein [Mycobacteriales bacterium]|jgi:hypothetical protein|nr:PH domain-containing protein [Mycobacteriales bacterium]
MPPAAVRFGLPALTGPGLLVFAAALAILGVSSDAAGRLLLAVAVLGFVGAALWTFGGPVISADTDALTVRGLLRRHQLPWAAVRTVRADTRRRSRAVEIETDGGLFAVPAVLLGRASPGEVVAALSAWQPAPGAAAGHPDDSPGPGG